MTANSISSLRERKQQRTRDDIRDAAMALFAERGFEAVTVTDIAARADVGRSTFFRYFPDKQDVLFADDADLYLLLASAIAAAVDPRAPLGDSLAEAIRVTRAGVLALSDAIARRAVGNPLRDQLIASSPQLQACSMAKQSGYVGAAFEALVGLGADSATAGLAAHLGAGCYAFAHGETASTPALLPAAVDAAFGRLTELS